MTDNKPGEPNRPSQSQPASKPAESEKPPQAVPERGEKLRSRAEKEMSEPTSASLLQEYRVPGVQYPASSNQLPEDWEDRETVVQKAEREQAEKIAKLGEKSSDLLEAAGGSSNAELQNLLAARAVAEQNQDEVGVKVVDQKLAELLK